MAEVKCPKCRGELSGVSHSQHCGCETVIAKCGVCGWQSPWDEVGHNGECYDAAEAFVLDSCAHLAYFDPRDRLPTPDEEAAHRATHGDGAGFMFRRIDRPTPWSSTWGGWRADIADSYRRNAAYESFAMVNGRPVAWPTP